MIVDLVGYRRWGHNEGDEPSYTQPTMYATIKDLPTVRARYAAQLVAEGLLTAEQADAEADQAYQHLAAGQTEKVSIPVTVTDSAGIVWTRTQ